MDDELFGELKASIKQVGEIRRGERAPSREFFVESEVKAVRQLTGLSQAKFAKAISVPVGTIQNWEQGRRYPSGPALVLLKLIKKNPELVAQAQELSV
mgnify:CR=1 FL=1